MKKYRKKPVVIEAKQWFKSGDHPEVTEEIWCRCDHCKTGDKELLHGEIKTLEGVHRVCSGDWIIKGIKGEFYACKPDIFEATYDEVK